jgi:hypothetical protein
MKCVYIVLYLVCKLPEVLLTIRIVLLLDSFQCRLRDIAHPTVNRASIGSKSLQRLLSFPERFLALELVLAAASVANTNLEPCTHTQCAMLLWMASNIVY